MFHYAWLFSLLVRPALANVTPAEIVAIQAPGKIQVLPMAEITGLRDLAELRGKVLPQDRRFSLARPLTQDDLYRHFRAEADVVVSRFVKFAVGALRINGIELDLTKGTAVRYSTESVHLPGRTTPGLIDACWECFGGAGHREVTAQQLGIDTGPLDGRASLNPRFTRQLVRGSAALYKFVFRTVQRGEVRVGLVLELDESYHPFVADLPVRKEVFGQRVMGSSQRVRLEVSATLDPYVFGLDHLAWTELDQFSVTTYELDSSVPRTFAEVAERAAPDQVRRDFVAHALRDLNENLRAFGMLTRERLVLPGKRFWPFE